MRVYVEAGSKKVFAGAIDWPGLARGAKTLDEALDALVRYVPRYRASLGRAAIELKPPSDPAGLSVAAELKGDSGTDFGVPSVVASFDRDDMSDAETRRQLALLRAAWDGFAKVACGARGKTLASGPRGGGRSLPKIVDHIAEADRAYIAALGAKAPPERASWDEIQSAFIAAVHSKLRGELPEIGPRGGTRWPARYAIRRSAWHALDHAWEIEDRLA